MTPSLTGQRSRSELIAELYERHAAGLFAYCHDQLGESSSAADAVVAVFTGVPIVEVPPRAALYALARREIYRRDVSYAMPAVDSTTDPATALIERVFRDIRPHQREVLLLSELCDLSTPELALVLDVADDTAEELAASARQRFTQTLLTATTAARSAPFVAPDVAEVYDAIAVAPIKDVLARLPWRRPLSAVRTRILSTLPLDDPKIALPARKLPTKKLWPTAPTWPLPLTDPNQVTNTCVVQTDAISPPNRSRRSRHEATTEPMPRLRGAIMSALADNWTRKRRAQAPAAGTPAGAATTEATAPAVEAAADAAAVPSAPKPAEASTPDAFDTFDAIDTFDAFRPAVADDQRPGAANVGNTATSRTRRAAPRHGFSSPSGTEISAPALRPGPVGGPARKDGDDLGLRPFRPDPDVERAQPKPTASSAGTATERPTRRPADDTAEGAAENTTEGTARAESAERPPARSQRRAQAKPIKVGEHHYDWLWELVGFLVCIVITLIVFFAVPMIVTP